MKKTVVIGASSKTSRYSNRACIMLDAAGIEFVPVGVDNGYILDKQIFNIRKKPIVEDVHTISLYINSLRQKKLYDYILSLNPKRLIFNPGTENSELKELAEKQGIEVEEACNLVLISTGQF